MSGLNGENGTGNGQIVFVENKGSSTQISDNGQISIVIEVKQRLRLNSRSNTNTLKHTRKGHKRLDICKTEAVNELVSGSDLGGFKGSIDDGNMGLLVLINLQEIVIEGVGKAGTLEVVTGKLLKGLLVEFTLEIFQG